MRLPCQCSRVICRTFATGASNPLLDNPIESEGKKIAVSSNTYPKPFEAIPGPKPSLPFIGTSWQYSRWGRYKLFKLHEALHERYYLFGDIMKEEFQWRKPVVHIFNPHDFEVVFRHQGHCPMRPANEFVRKYRLENKDKYSSVGLTNALGDEWYKLRTALAPVLLQMKSMQGHLSNQSVICEDFAELIRHLRDSNSHVVTNIQDQLSRLALESIFMLCLDSRLGCLHTNLSEHPDAKQMITAAHQLFQAYQELYYGLPLWKYYPTAPYKKYEAAESLIYSTAHNYIQRALDKLDEEISSEDKVSGIGSTLLQVLLKTEGLSRQDAYLTIIDFIAGGVFTITNALCFLLHHLACNPDVQEKLFQELKMAQGNITGCSYLRACVKESFRLSPTVPGIMRILPEEVILSDHYVPPGTPVFANSLVTCRLPRYFTEPHKFRPERWLGAEKASIHPFALLPFGHGARMCAGRRFAEMELLVTAATMVQNFVIEPVSEELDVNFVFIVVPADPVHLIFKDRK